MDSINTERSYTEYEVTEPTTDFAIGFDNYSGEDKDAIHVTLDGVNLGNLDYTVVRKNAQVIEVTPAIESGVVRLQRETYIDQAFHTFTAGALFSPKSMDENFAQVRRSQQEVNDGFTFLAENTNGVVAAADAATARANAAAELAESFDVVELENEVSSQSDLIANQGIILDAQKLDTGITATAKFGGVARTQAAKNSDVLSVKDFGAVGDGIADDTLSIQTAIDASYDIGVLNISSGNYKITSMLEIKEPLKLFGTGATILSDEDITILQITHSDVEINGLGVVGNFVYPNYRKNGNLIYAKGESVPNNAPIEIENITIKDCRLRNGARSGVELLHVNGFTVSGCDIRDCGYSGVASSSGKNGLVENNIIEEIGSVQINNYGVYFSQVNSHDVIANPVSVNCVARNNKIKNITWEGLDCHGGNGIEFIGNYLQDCGQKNASIMIAHSDGEDKEPVSGAENVKIIDNTIVITDVGAYGHGIATSSAIESSSIQISGNLVVGCGKGLVSHAGILLGYVKDTLVSDNIIKNIYGVGVYISKRAKSTSIKNNSIIDVSSATVGNAIAIRVVRTEGDVSDQVEVAGNSLLSGGLVAPNLNEDGLYSLGDVGKLSIGDNNFKIAEKYQYHISSSQFDRATSPVMNYGNIKMVFDGTTSTLSEVIVLDNEHSGNTLYECVASCYTASNPNIDFVFTCSKVNTKSIKITARTADGSNFNSENSLGFSFITVGC